jgi:processive 1,2-diacylglycerol beta-glucosyltransferase
MNNLLVILPGELIPSAEIRLLNVFRRMSDVRFSTVELSRGLTRDFEDRIKDADIVVFQRNRDINSKHILDFCLSIDKIVVFDIDDDLLSIPNVSNTPTTGEMNRILGYFLRNSSHVTTSTERLKERYFSFNSRIRVIENTIDTNKWCVRSRRRDNGETRMLLANTDYFKLLDFRKSFVDVLRVILADETTKLYIIGVVPSHRLLSEKNVYFYEQIWGYDKYLKKVSDFDIDIALVPLEDMEFHSSKSLIKYIDYSALGIPGIYSNVLPYKGSVMKHMDNCLLVDNVYDDWHKAIRNLVDDRALRERLRERSFKTVRENYDISRAVKEWRAFIDELKKTKGSLYIPSGEGEPSGEAERFKRQFSVFERQYYNSLHLKAAFVAKKLRRFPHLKKSLSYIYYGFLRVLDVARELNRLFSHGHREEKMTIPVKLMESLKLFQDKSGLEVGGPSVFFKYIYPLYSVVGSLDNVDYRV